MARKAKRQPLSQDRQVRALKPENEVYEHAISDCKGLRIRVYTSGRKSWLYRYRDRESNALKRMVIGEYKTRGMSLADARIEADKQRVITNEHGSAKDYREEKRKEQRAALAEKRTKAQKNAFTVEKLITAYLNEASRELKSWREIDRALRAYVVPHLGDVPAHEVRRSDVIAALDKLSKAGKKVQANRTLAYLRRAYNWGIQNELVGANPCHMIARHKESSKERHLSDSELKRFFKNLPDSGLDSAMQDYYSLILLTALRPGEVASLAGSNYDEDERAIRLETTKSGKSHLLPVSEQAAEIIERRVKESPSQWLFPSKRDPKRHIRGDAVQRPLRNAITKLKVTACTPHDLRRTAGTGLAALGAPRLIVSMVLNHADQSVTSIYDRHHYLPELKGWVDKWGTHVSEVSLCD